MSAPRISTAVNNAIKELQRIQTRVLPVKAGNEAIFQRSHRTVWHPDVRTRTPDALL